MDSIFYPMKLRPIIKNAIWGGSFLSDQLGKAEKGSQAAESWELSLRPPHDISTVVNGSYAGARLNEIPLFSEAAADFPLLIKYLDAASDLSVQVHPLCGEAMKSELWYVLHAEIGAKIVYGLKPSANLSELARRANDGSLLDILNYLPVSSGEIYYIPPGMVHALGAGITVAEIQTNSNTTYRLYDYNRRQADGTYRQLHIDDAVKNARIYASDEIHALQFASSSAYNSVGKLLAATNSFTVELIAVESRSAPFQGAPFTVLMCVDGKGNIETSTEAYPYERGDTYIVPMQCGHICIHGGTVLSITPR